MKNGTKAVLLCLMSALISPQAHAAGYELLEQSANAVGQATAGVSTGYGDGSEVYFNPAAMSLLLRPAASAGIHFVVPKAKFRNQGSAYVPQLGGSSVAGANGPDGGGLNLVPNIYGVWKLSDTVSGGIGVNSPFGLSTKYDDNWVGRYHAIDSELMTVNINPAVSVKLGEGFSVGTGLQILYADAKLTNAIDFGTIGAATLGIPAASSLGLRPQQSDGFASVNGNDWGVGAGVGGVYAPSKDLRFGVSWRSKINLRLEGDTDFVVPANAMPLTGAGLFTHTGDEADVTLPESIAFGGAGDVSDGLTVFADAAWTRWTRFDQLTVKFDSPQPDSILPGNWNNTWRYALGARYLLDKDFVIRSGVAWDESPIADGEHRTPRVPDQDRFWIAAGIGYNLAPDVVLSVDYAHLFVRDSQTASLANATGAVLNGSWDLGVDLASVSVTTFF